MKLLFRQRIFSWFDSYDIYDESGSTAYRVQGVLAWGHKLKVYDARGNERAMLREEVLSFLPRFRIYIGDNYMGCIRKHFSLFHPRFSLDFNTWQVEGDFFGWDYQVTDNGQLIMTASKELFRLSDTYQIDVVQEKDALMSLMIVLAIDAALCSQN